MRVNSVMTWGMKSKDPARAAEQLMIRAPTELAAHSFHDNLTCPLSVEGAGPCPRQFLHL